MRSPLDTSTIVLAAAAVVLAGLAYLKDPGLPLLGAKNGFSMLAFVLPRMVVALLLAGLMQVLVPQDFVSRHFGQGGGLRALLLATLAGVVTPGGPMVTMPFMVALANSGAALSSLVAEITDRVSKSPAERNVALLFERVEGFDMPVLVNAFGAQDRMGAALGVSHLDELGERVAKLLDLKLPGTFAERLGKLHTLFDLVKAGPKRVTTAPCQEVVETARPSMAGLPALQCWPGDGGRYITLPGVFTRDPRTGQRNVGMYRLQVFDERTLGMHWQTHKGGAEHHRVAEEQATSATRMPVAIALGGDPAMIYAASAPLPPGVDEVVFAGWLRGKGVELVRCVTNDLEVPAQAEIVLEGYVDPRERRREGPFGDRPGYD